jgi:uncharacterized protein (TIGR02594 family)
MKIYKTWATLLFCAVALALAVASATARPRHQTVQASGQADSADQDVRYANAPVPAPEVPAAKASGRRHGRGSAYEAAQSHSNSAYVGFTGNTLVEEARKYIGSNPTGRGSLWCGAFMDLVLKRTGHAGGGNLARGYSRYGTRVAGPQVGAIAVMHGHVGVVSGVDANGNPIIVSGNHNRTVAEAVYPRGRVSAYVMP